MRWLYNLLRFDEDDIEDFKAGTIVFFMAAFTMYLICFL